MAFRQGYITSDCDAVWDVMYSHHYTNTTAETCAAVLEAGMVCTLLAEPRQCVVFASLRHHFCRI